MDELTTSRVAWIDSDSARRARVRAWVDGQCSVVEYEPDGRLEDFDAFVVEQAHPRVNYAKFIADLRQRGLDTPVLVIVTDVSQIGIVLRAGAYDVLREPMERGCCEAALCRARERQVLAKRLRALQASEGVDVVPLRELERRAIEKALAATRGSVEKAARMLGMGRATLYRRLATMAASSRSVV
jgi:DNA-binding NtrC family response regulator